MRLRVKRGTTAVIASDEHSSASLLLLAMNAVGPRLNRGRASCGPHLHFFLTAVDPFSTAFAFLLHAFTFGATSQCKTRDIQGRRSNRAYYNLYLGLGVVYRLFAAR